MGAAMGTGIHTGWEPRWEPGWAPRGSSQGPHRPFRPPQKHPGLPGEPEPRCCSGDGALLLMSLLSSSGVPLGPARSRARFAVTGAGPDRAWLAPGVRANAARAYPLATAGSSPLLRAVGSNISFLCYETHRLSSKFNPKSNSRCHRGAANRKHSFAGYFANLHQ